MVACAEGTSVPHRDPNGGSTLQQCKDACDASPVAACRSFSYSGATKNCKLWRTAGEPRAFCNRQDWSSYWRVEIPSRSGTAAVSPPVVAATGLPRRALVQGRQLIDSASGAALQLHGLNIYLDYVRFDDMALMRQLLPSANVVRLVGVFWHDHEQLKDCVCCTDDITQGYFAPSCLEKLKATVRTITDRGIWVFIAAKARYAAGEAPDRYPDVFHDSELARRFRELWRHLTRELQVRDLALQTPRAPGHLTGVPSGRGRRANSPRAPCNP